MRTAARSDVPTPGGTPRRRERSRPSKHEDKLTAILRVAAQLFAENGYEATSLDSIADRLGMHKATLYHYAESKESILYQCLVRSFEDLESVVARMADRSIPVLERLHDFAAQLARAQNNDFGRCLALVGARPVNQVPGGVIRKFQKRLDTTVRNLITEGIADGSIRPCNPGLASALIFGALNWVPRWYRTDGKLSVDQISEAFVDIFANGLSTARR